MNLRAINILLCLSIIVLLLLQLRSCQKAGMTEGVLQAQRDSLYVTKNRLGQETAVRLAMVGTVSELKRSVIAKDSLLRDLSSRLNAATISLTMVKNQTTSQTAAPTTVAGNDTSVVNDTVFVYPQYTTTYQDKWERYSIRALRDSIYLEHTAFNYYAISQNYRKQGFFKPKAVEVSVMNMNPKTVTVEAQSFLVTPKKENRLVWLMGSFLAGWIGCTVLDR